MHHRLADGGNVPSISNLAWAGIKGSNGWDSVTGASGNMDGYKGEVER